MRARRVVLGALVLGLLVLVAPAAAAPWRCNGSAALCDRPFDRVVLPATHNSMSAASLGWRIPNQPVALPAQLRAGIRGLLIDTHYGHVQPDGTVANDEVKTRASRLYLCHELCSIGATRLSDALRDIAAFLRAHPREVLLIDQEDYISPADWTGAVRAAGLDRYVYRGSTSRWPTLRTMIARSQRLVLLAEHRGGGAPWNHAAYRGILQETPYTFEDPELLTESSVWPSSCRANRGGTRGSLFLLNHWSPPVAPDPATSDRVNSEGALVGRALTCRRIRGRMPTIVAVDMFSRGQLFRAVRELNTLAR